eukprot:TRINITY_DN3716_c0_g1_i2.p1 TRINITY_DN3716_c0_g1~~TRINITY_DN3716_c0_g1_i2.p1  ORF type:complete len:690 (+),score=121.32 TRINITY_DN3716_c0_g1_i2:88-2157(+)
MSTGETAKATSAAKLQYERLLRVAVLRLEDTSALATETIRDPAEAFIFREELRVDVEVQALSKIAQHDSKERVAVSAQQSLERTQELSNLEDEEACHLFSLTIEELEHNVFRPPGSAVFTALPSNPQLVAENQQRLHDQLRARRAETAATPQFRGLLERPVASFDWQSELFRVRRQFQQMAFLCSRYSHSLVKAAATDPALSDPAAPGRAQQVVSCDPYILTCRFLKQTRLSWLSAAQHTFPQVDLEKLKKAVATLGKIEAYRVNFVQQRWTQLYAAIRESTSELAQPQPATIPLAQPGSVRPAAPSPVLPEKRTPPRPRSGLPTIPPPPLVPAESKQQPQSAPTTHITDPSGKGRASSRSPPPGQRKPFAWEAPATQQEKQQQQRERLFRARRRLAALRIQRWFRRWRYWNKAKKLWRAMRGGATALSEAKEYRKKLLQRVTAAQRTRSTLVSLARNGTPTDQRRLLEWDAVVQLQCFARRIIARNAYLRQVWAVLTIQRFIRGYIARRYTTRSARAVAAVRERRRHRRINELLAGCNRAMVPQVLELVEWQLHIQTETKRIESELAREEGAFQKNWKQWETKMTKQLLQGPPVDTDWVQKFDNANGRQYFLNVKNNAIAHEHPNLKYVEKNKQEQWPKAVALFEERVSVLEQYKSRLEESEAGHYTTVSEMSLQQALRYYDHNRPKN